MFHELEKYKAAASLLLSFLRGSLYRITMFLHKGAEQGVREAEYWRVGMKPVHAGFAGVFVYHAREGQYDKKMFS